MARLTDSQNGAQRTGVRRAFDSRARSYARSQWHQVYAERLVHTARPTPGVQVIDAACGTGFATIAAARAVGPGGNVLGVDISTKMLQAAQAHDPGPGAAPIQWRQADAATMPGIRARSVDLVLCAAGLLYLPVPQALTRWRELLRPGGMVAFSTMRAGYPIAANLFRQHATSYGLELTDPAASLGQDEACRQVLGSAGLDVVRIVSDTVQFSFEDLAGAWEAHARGPHHRDIERLSPAEREDFRASYSAEIQRRLNHDPEGVCSAQVIYAVGRA